MEQSDVWREGWDSVMPKRTEARVRAVLGGPLGKRFGTDIPLSRATMDAIGELLVESIVAEARRDLAVQGFVPTPEGQPVGIPTSDSFFESFGYRIRGRSTIEITCSWPWITDVIEGRDPYKMTWLTRQKGSGPVIPLVQRDGTVLLRAAPLTLDKAWIHPGFARHTFIQRGVRKARERLGEVIKSDVIKVLTGG